LILLGADNKVLAEGIQHKVEAEKKEPCDAKLYDFDNVTYRLFIDPADRSKMLISLQTKNWGAIRNQGSEQLIKDKLADYVKNVTDDGVNFEINLEDQKQCERAEELGNSFSKLRIYALGGPVYRYLKALESGKAIKEDFEFAFRPDTYLWLVSKEDRLTCVFSLEFPIKADRIIANQILTEFVEVRRMKDASNTPVVSFSQKEAPGELKGKKLPQINQEAFVGYFSVLVLPGHIKGEDKLMTAVENLVGFRAYLTYHIKCAKAFFHESMRARVKDMLKVLNRARYEEDDTRKKKKIIVSAK